MKLKFENFQPKAFSLPKTMKTFLSLILALFVSTAVIAAGENPNDTVIVRLKNGNKIMLVVNNGDMKSFKNYDFQALIQNLDTLGYGKSNATPADTNIKIVKTKAEAKPKRTTERVEIVRENGTVTITKIEGSGYSQTVTEKQVITPKPVKPWGTHGAFDLDLGLNTYLEDGRQVDNDKPYLLDQLNSRYVSIGLKSVTRIASSKSNYLKYGFDVAWNNFKYEKYPVSGRRMRIEQDGTNLVWRAPAEGQADFDDSKLTIAWLNLPLMLIHRSKEHGLRYGIGGWFGYRLTAYNKVTQNGKWDPIRSGGDFNLNNYQWGVRGEVGWRGVNVFVNYALTPLHRPDANNPTLTPISFGISL